MSSPVNRNHNSDAVSREAEIDDEQNYGSISNSSESQDNTLMDRAFEKAGGFGRY